MNLQEEKWQPSREEIDRMVAELRPILAAMAVKDRQKCETRTTPRRCR